MKHRLVTLDALRGLAALVVLLFHFQVNGVISAYGYLAVDFFFILSGFVIARTFDARLATDMSFRRFVALRVIRIYPLFLVGLAVGFIRSCSYLALNRPGALTIAQVLDAGSFELFMLPSLVTRNLFVLNAPSWSLFFEMAVNFVYAAFLFRARTRTLVLTICVFAVALVCTAWANGTVGVGNEWSTSYGGVARTGFSFVSGMLISRLNKSSITARWIAIIPMVALVACLMAPPMPSRVLFDLLVVMVVSPVLIYIGASVNPPVALQPVSKLLGELSYPVYAIHYPLMFLYLYFAKRAGIGPAWQLAGFIGLVGVLAWLLNKYFDIPVRRWLTARLGRSPAIAVSEPLAR